MVIAANEFVDVLPSAFWALVVGFALYLFRAQIRSLLGRVGSARLPLNVEVRFQPALAGAQIANAVNE
ncbi:MAG TPA: hypothetical protein VH247_00590 [Thermoleophilaceae bacterium]|jgi:hypothetical protein|nr:hypothetical protein [Thermoleophilaceae bacterium]